MATKYAKIQGGDEQRSAANSSKGYPPDLNRGGGFSRDFDEVRDYGRDFNGFRPTGSTMMQGFVSYEEELRMVSPISTDSGVVGLGGSEDKEMARSSKPNFLLFAIAGAVIFLI